MIVFLEKIRVKTIFSAFEPVKVEPLELCCLKSVLNNMNIENYLIDDLFKLKAPLDKHPDIVILTGYNVAEQKLIETSEIYKLRYPNIKIIVGGVHIQKNKETFYVNSIDYVFHSQSLNTFKLLIEKILKNDRTVLSYGVDCLIKDKLGNKYWHLGKEETVHENENYKIDRNIFKQISKKTRYLEKRNVALIKGSIGCPYNCSYCFCKEINNNQYIKADYKKMAEEMENIEADYFWIVDDVLFTNGKDAEEFIDIFKQKNSKLKIIAYLRADFILKEQDLLKELREVGIVEVIVGFEATNNNELKNYQKTTNAMDYPKVISLLKESNIDLTALFMVHPDYKLKDFRNLNKFIRNNKIDVFTISIFTPIKGTKSYENLKENLITLNPEHFDFMHLTLKSKLPKFLFYILFYCIHLNLLKSKRIWTYIKTQLMI